MVNIARKKGAKTRKRKTENGVIFVECHGDICEGEFLPETEDFFYKGISTCKECYNKMRRDKKQNNDFLGFIKYKVKAAKDNANSKGREVAPDLLNIVLAQYKKQKGKCAFSKVELALESDGHPNELSIDRIDFNKGYVKGNIQLITFPLNRLKGAVEYQIDKYLRTGNDTKYIEKMLKQLLIVKNLYNPLNIRINKLPSKVEI